jgi:hypothetical protein
MSVSDIPDKIKLRLWVKAGGNCQYEGCNKPLWKDELTQTEMNTAYIAHIYAESPGGPRYDKILSPKLCKDISGIMLMCDPHHRKIDREEVPEHPAERLIKMKTKHEERIEIATSIKQDKQSHIVLYGANIGDHNVSLNWKIVSLAMFPDWLPAEKPGLILSITNSGYQDNELDYWKFEKENLGRLFQEKVKPKIQFSDIKHFSVFGFAPQPLLIELGRLIGDINNCEVYQLHREPPSWKWHNSTTDINYDIVEPLKYNSTVALNISLSDTIDNSRIKEVLGDTVSIWTLTISHPDKDFLKSQDQLSCFRTIFRKLLADIKLKHGQKNMLHVFPCAPVSVAVEIGRVWMQKADLPLRIYDQNSKTGGFIHALDIENK